MLLDLRTMNRGGYRILSATKTVLSVTKVNSWKPFTIFTNISASNVTRVLNALLMQTCTIIMGMVLEHDTCEVK